MIPQADVTFYRQNGYLVVPDVLSPAELDETRRVTDELVAAARGIRSHTDVYDLEDSQGASTPRVRRIKAPHRLHQAYAALVRHPRIVEVLQQLLSPSVRFDTSKLNLKSAGYGAPVEWHQDWAFYPHTNDDLAAVGVLLDDCGEDNAPLQVVPGSHLGPVHDHHRNGRFCGAIDPDRCGLDVSKAAALTGKAGSITIHHVRAVHGSAPNRSARERRLLLHQYAAADAWPLLGVDDFESWKANQLTGEPCVVPRLADVPVRLPLPPAEQQGSIYENQRGLGGSFWADARPPSGARLAHRDHGG
jgi:phytanoyl-CoA hydroxylase